MAIPERDFGQLEQAVKNLTEGVDDLRAEVKGMDIKVDGILSKFDQVQGGYKVLLFLGGFAGVAGSVLTTLALKMWPFLLGTLPKV